jgi:hypothetical protein
MIALQLSFYRLIVDVLVSIKFEQCTILFVPRKKNEKSSKLLPFDTHIKYMQMVEGFSLDEDTNLNKRQVSFNHKPINCIR